MNKFVSIYTFMILTTCMATFANAENGVVAQWRFTSDAINGQTLQDQAGNFNTSITGDVVINQVDGTEFMLINNENTIITPEYQKDRLPTEAITVESWLAIEKTVEWGGIISSMQSGNGFLFGFKQSNFGFGITTEDTPGISEVRAFNSLEWGEWYHVVGTYDGNHLKLYVNGELVAENDTPSGKIVYPENCNFAVGAWMIDNKNFHWRGWMHETRILDHALSADTITQNYQDKKDQFPDVIELEAGPYIKRLDSQSLSIAWQTSEAVNSSVYFGKEIPMNNEYKSEGKKTSHQVKVEGILPEEIYHYRVVVQHDDGSKQFTRIHEFDSTFDYTYNRVLPTSNPFDDEQQSSYNQLAKNTLSQFKQTRGYALILGGGEGRLAYELAKQSDFQIIIVEPDMPQVQKLRQTLDDAKIYGSRVSVHHGNLDDLPYTSYFANLIMSETTMTEGTLPPSAKEAYRVLRPCGGVMVLGQSQSDNMLTSEQLSKWVASLTPALSQGERGNRSPDEQSSPAGSASILSADVDVQTNDSGTWLTLTRGALPNSGDWSHMYANGGNTACSLDAYPQDPMRIMWFGEPGPRPMVDRGTRPAGPLSVNGRLYVQGDRRLFGLDAYNGTILWTLEIPNLRRANVPRDSGNMAASDTHLYAAIENACWQFNGNTGEVEQHFFLPKPNETYDYDWGYMAYDDNKVIGSTVKEGGIFIGADGEWYDASNQESEKVISDSLFAFDTNSGTPLWHYKSAAIMNSTICFGDGYIYFIESRNPQAIQSQFGRLPKELLTDRVIVKLDMQTGEKVWEKPYDFTEGRWVFYMCYAQNTLVVLSTTNQYQIYAFDTEQGDLLWQHEYEWYRDHHGGAMQRPVIVDNTVYAEPRIFELRSGTMADKTMPERNKCGTITASAQSLFYRDYYHGFWDLEKDTRTHFVGVRPGCWLGVIPAGGVVLAPESSAGCYCAHPIQTSLAFIPTVSLSK